MARKTPSRKIPSNAGKSNAALAIFIGTGCGIVGGAHSALAGPTGGQVTNGQGSISTPTGNSTVIDQSSRTLSIDWQSFDVASNESVRFNQPSSNSVALNRILDQKPSEIFGRIDANGSVVLFNSNGMVFGPGSHINVGSLVATSLNVISFDEATGKLRLAGSGAPGSIVNNGTISAAPNGSVSLAGGSVANNGLIVADYGAVNLAAGRAATIDFYGGGLLRFDADSSLTENASGALAGVSNAGEIQANGGQVLLTTSAVRNVFDRAINNDGIVRANHIDKSGGTIRLVGAGGTVVSSGTLDASGVGAGSTGGSVQVLGENVGLFGNAVVDVSGDAGGGLALIGGDFQGKNADVLNARRTIVAPGASINADARLAGNGGKVIVWADDYTSYYGDITARGGADSGNGGFVETSGHHWLSFDGTVSTTAAHGKTGTLLLDPEEININAGNGGTTNVDLDFQNPMGGIIDLNASAVVAALNSNDVDLQATDTIRVNTSIDASAATNPNHTLSLSAGDNVNIADGVTIRTRDGDITITAGDDDTTPVSPMGTGDVLFGDGSVINAGNADIEIRGDGPMDLTTGTAGATIVTNGGTISLITAGAITLDNDSVTAGAGTVNLDSNASITDSNDVSVSAATLNILGATNVNIETTIGTFNATGVTGNVVLTENGDVTVGNVNVGGDATITASGAIDDQDSGTTASNSITADNITLTAGTRIGTIALADLRAGIGSSVDLNTTGDLDVTVTANNGQINLNLVSIPNVDVDDISLGSGAATGTILLQRAGDLSFGTFTNGAIDIDTANAAVGLRSNGTLTLPSTVNNLFDVAPGTLAVHGTTDIVDTDGTPRTIAFALGTAGDLIFDSGAAGGNVTLSTNIDQLTADIGGGSTLDVVESGGAINLVNVVADGTIDVGSTGNIVVGVVQSRNDDVALASSTGDIVDDLDLGGIRTRITGDAVSISGGSIGTLAAAGEIDTDANTLVLHATDGNLLLLERTAATITNFSAVDGTETQLSTEGGALNTLVDLRPTTGNLTITAVGAASNLNYAGRTLGRSSGTGNVSIFAGGDLTTGTIVSNGGTVEAGFGQAAGNLTLSNVGGSAGTIVARAAGTITGAATPSVTAGTLSITRATSVNLDTNVNNLNSSGVTGALTVHEQTGNLTATSVTAGGLITLETVDGVLTASNVTGTAAGVALTAGGATGNISLGTVNGGANTVTLNASGTITDTGSPSVAANQLTITAANSVDLETNVNTLNASGVTAGLTVRELSGALSVANAAAGGAVNVTTAGGALNVTAASSSGSNVTLGAGGANALTLGTVTAATGTVSLSAGGAITDGAGTSVTANQLTVTSAGSVNLDTDVNTLNASNVATTLTINEQTGPLTVTNATATGLVTVSTVAGDLNVTNADGAGVTLNSAGAMALTAVDSNAGTATLTAAGAITGGAGAVTGNRLSVTQAASVNVGTAVNNLNAVGVAGGLTVADADNITIETVTAGGNVALTSNGGAILDDGATTTITGANIALSASTAIGSISNFNTGAGSAVDVNVLPAGTLTANVTQSNSTARVINLEVAGAPIIPINGITLGSGTGRQGQILLQNPGPLDLNGLNLGAINIGDTNNVSVGYISGGLLTLRDTGSVTDFAPANLLVRGTDVVTNGVDPRTIALTAGTLNFYASAPGGDFLLNTDVDFLNADVGNVATLSVNQVLGAGSITLGNIVSNSLTVNTRNNANAAILDDGDDSTVLTGAQISLSSRGSIGSNAGTGAIDVNTPNLFAASYTEGGSVFLNSVNTGTTTMVVGASVLNAGAAGNGDVNIRALGDIDAGILQAEADTVTVNTTGRLFHVGVGADLVNADQLVITQASSVDLNATNINTLNASGVTGALSITEGTGALTVTNAMAGTVTLATVDGNLNVTNAASGTGATTLTAGGVGAALAITTASGAGGLTASTVDGALTANTVSSSGGPITLSAGGTGSLTIGTAIAAGAITATTVNGALNATTIDSSGGAVTLTAGGANALTFGDVSGVGVNLTTGAALTLGTVDAGAGTATLTAGGAITDAAGPAASVTANQLTITAATSADLDTNIATLDASGVTGTLTVREQNALAVTNANAAGTVSLSTLNGALNVTNATSTGGALSLASTGGPLTVATGAGTGATLTSTGAITLGTVTTTGGTTTLNATGAITDAAGPTSSVVANQLTITGAGSVDLDTDVNTVSSNNVAGTLTVREQNGALTVSNVNANGAINVSTIGGALTVSGATSTTGAVTAAAGGGGTLTVNSLTGSGATLTGGAMTLAQNSVNVVGGTATLTATGAITDAAGATASIIANQLTISGAASADLDTNVNTLNATGVTGILAVREQNGALAVTNANATGAVNVSTVGGTLTVANAASSGGTLTLAAGGGNALSVTTAASGATGATLTGSAVTVNTVSGGTGIASITATGDLQVTTATGTGATLSSGGVLTAGTVNAGSGALSATSTGALNLTSSTSNGATLNSGAALTAGTVNAGTGALNMTSAGALALTTGSGGSTTLNSGAALTIGTLGVGTGTASLTAVGALTDNGAVPALTAGASTLTAATIGSAANPFNTSIASLSSNSNVGSTYIREANDIVLTSLTAASNQDIVVGAVRDITVSQISVSGTNGAGRVLLAAGSDILSTGTGTNITAQDVELRAGGLDQTTGGHIGADGNILRIDAPRFTTGGDGNDVPSVVLIQNRNPSDFTKAANTEQVDMVSGAFDIGKVPFNPAGQTEDGFLTTRFSTRTAFGQEITLINQDFLSVAATGFAELGNINQSSLSSASEAASGQGEAALYVDWASFDPNISLFGTVNPPVCLPRDQQDDDTSDTPENAPESGAGSGGGSGCASTTAQFDNEPLGLPELRLVLTNRGMEWVRVRVPVRHLGAPLRIAQSR